MHAGLRTPAKGVSCHRAPFAFLTPAFITAFFAGRLAGFFAAASACAARRSRMPANMEENSIGPDVFVAMRLTWPHVRRWTPSNTTNQVTVQPLDAVSVV